MDTTRDKAKKQHMKTKSSTRKDKKHKSGKLFRRKSLKSLGNFMNRILKTLGTLAQFGDVDQPDAEDDDGGFRDSTACTLSAHSGNFKDDFHGRGISVKKSSTLSFHGSVRERLSWCYGDKTPGVQGLKNHGNTCFMNAVVQCLSNTDLLAEYLGLEQYKSDLSQRRLNGIVRGEEAQPPRGEVTEQLALLVRALWTLDYTPQLSVEFKSIVSKYGSQFRGNSQHDALEFLLWLLDRVHEDANPSTNNHNSKTKAPAKGPVGTDDSPACGPANAQQPGTRHSFVQEHFQAQYRSSLTCPHCLKQSNTFDPFLCISLPIPLRQTRPLNVTLAFSTKGQRHLRVGLAVPLFGSVSILRAMVAEEGKISPDQVILAEIYPKGFQRSFSDDDDLTSIAESDIIYAFQALPHLSRGGSTRFSGYHHSLPSSPYISGPEGQRLPSSGALSSEFLNQGGSSKLLLLMCNTTGTGQQALRFGPPFLMREDRSISWEQLQQNILSQIYYLMLNGSHAQNAAVLFKIRVVSGSTSSSYLSPQDSRPLCHPAVDRALKLCGPGGPLHVKLVIEWEQKLKECLFGNIQEEVVKDAESVRIQQQNHLQQHSCTLDECFQLYTKEEQLAPDDAWKCPHCKQLQQGMVKMSLWTLPDILILHLKRFRQVGERRNKLSTLVRFPLTGLDMAPHVVKRSQSTRNLSPWPPTWKQSETDFLYDLYAVCNHHGGMHGGHYTAYCRNSVDGQWYSYDDSSVDQVPEEELCTRGAYILFYQRRNVIPPWSANSSARGSISSSMSDHWLIRLNGDSKRGSVVSRSTTTYPSSIPDSPESPVFQDEPSKEERGGFETRPFVRGIQGRSVSMRSPTKSKENFGKVLPLRWSLGSKDRHKPAPPSDSSSPAELVQYLESGRRPRCTKDSIVNLMGGPSGKELREGQKASTDSASNQSSLSCIGHPDSPKMPEGQRRQPSDKTGNHRPSSNSRHREDDTLSRRSGRKTKQEHSKSQDSQSRRSSNVGVQSSYGTHSDWESTKKTGKEDVEEPFPDVDKGTKGEQSKGNVLSFLRNSFLRKDQVRKTRESDKGSEVRTKSSSKLSLSNGGPSGPVEEKAKGTPQSLGEELANGRPGRSAADIRRSHSSSNINNKNNKSDHTLRRTASLHRNGISAPPSRSQTSEKTSHGTPQRIRYSTTSLGRKKTVPESSF
ncbi:ubiquitin carboxyl-terminal hydrolase 43a [Chanos chanos]|uniref:ubiquitinyl hydrolase 1 n=1 Tax=Chanos chanos TaxID=29144 RepID=A0A6J2W2B2_CHACN|nr:ubiquitin carboxyl-terminal hydrolase 43-like [Chanos chanos]